MLAEKIDSFSIEPHPDARRQDNEALESRLLFEGRDTGYFIKGIQLDQRQYRTQHYYLVFSNWDCPHEESCEISLISNRLNVVASRTIGAWYNSYWLESVEAIAPDEFLLGFGEDTNFQLSINYPRRFRFRFMGWRAMRLSRENTVARARAR